MGLRMQPRHETFVTERWAGLAKRLHDTEHAGDDIT
jgi:hypothetical protein